MTNKAKSTINGLIMHLMLKDDEHFTELIVEKNQYEEEMRKTKEENQNGRCVVCLWYCILYTVCSALAKVKMVFEACLYVVLLFNVSLA